MAIDDLLDEHEQSERVRAWVRNNAVGVIGGIALGLGAIVGYQWWQGQRLHARMGANAEYARAMVDLEAGKLPADKGAGLVARLDKANPTLSTLAALQLAKAQAEAGKRDEAIATLRGLKAPDALLGDDRNPAMLDARGDAEFALGQREQAQASYRKALALIDVGNPQHRLIALKLIEAGGTPPHTEDNA